MDIIEGNRLIAEFMGDEISLLKETFGKDFLTEEYPIKPFKALY